MMGGKISRQLNYEGGNKSDCCRSMIGSECKQKGVHDHNSHY
jgi:hypothetical protein